MALLFGSPNKKKGRPVPETKLNARLEMARSEYLSGRVKIVTTEEITEREIQRTYGLIVCRSYNFDKAFFGMVAQTLEVNADAVVGYREHVSFHPEGDKYFSCFGTAVQLKPKKI